METEDLNELWESDAGTITCPKCGSYGLQGHIKERCKRKRDFVVVDWFCKDCRFKWSSCCPFEDGLLTAI
jgi:hypothetical protein